MKARAQTSRICKEESFIWLQRSSKNCVTSAFWVREVQGKTSLGEAMLFAAGATQRLGKVLDGTSVLDHEPEEIKHQVSISTAFHSLAWKKHRDDVDRHAGLRGVSGRLDQQHARHSAAPCSCSIPVGRRCGSNRSAYGRSANDDGCQPACCSSARWTTSRPTSRERIAPMLETLEAKGLYLQMPIGTEAGFKGVVDLAVDEGVYL